jgi:hypothetical protein
MVRPPVPTSRKRKNPPAPPPILSEAESKSRENLGTSIASLVMPASVDLTATSYKPKPGSVPACDLARKKTLPKLPHERDESVSATPPIPSKPMQQAYRDVARGLQDTDRAAETGRTYKKLKQK